jgi:hypothetical protein
MPVVDKLGHGFSYRLIFDLASIYPIEAGQAIDPVTGTRLWAFAFPFEECFWFYAAAGIALWLLLCKGS